MEKRKIGKLFKVQIVQLTIREVFGSAGEVFNSRGYEQAESFT